MKTFLAYLSATLIASSAAWLPFSWETFSGQGPADTTFIIAATSCLGAMLSAVPFLLLLTLGKRLHILDLPYSLFAGILLSEWTFQSALRVNWLLGAPDDPFIRGWSTSPGMNGSMLVGGLLGGVVFWGISLRAPKQPNKSL